MKMESNMSARPTIILVEIFSMVDENIVPNPFLHFAIKRLSCLIWISLVINQVYDAQITPIEYVMRGNSAILKCLIPSFVSDFVQVIAWMSDDGEEFLPQKDFVGGKNNLISHPVTISFILYLVFLIMGSVTARFLRI